MNELVEYKQLMQVRGAVYDALSRLLDHPDMETLTGYTEMIDALLPTLQGLPSLHQEMTEAMQIIAAWHEAEKDEVDLKQEFTALFCMGKGSVGSCASVYFSPQRLIKREPWTLVRTFYAACGYEPQRFTGLEDSMGMELAFLAQQSITSAGYDTLAMLQGSFKLQQEFIDKHLLFWASDFCNDVIISEKSDLYAGIAQSLNAFLEYDCVLLNVVMEDAA